MPFDWLTWFHHRVGTGQNVVKNEVAGNVVGLDNVVPSPGGHEVRTL